MKKISKLKSVSFYSKSLLIFAIIIPIIILGFSSIYIASKYLEKEIYSSNYNKLEIITYNLSRHMQDPIKELKNVELYIENDDFTISQVVPSLFLTHEYFLQIQLSDTNGIVEYCYPMDSNVIDTDVSGFDYFKYATKDGFWAPSFVDNKTDISAISYSFKTKKGIITAFISLAYLKKFERIINRNSGKIITITDNHGVYISHTDSTFVKKRSHDHEYNEHKEMWDSKAIESNFIRITDNEYISTIIFLDQSQWKVAINQSIPSLYTPIKKMIFIFVSLGILILIIAIYIAKKLNGHITSGISTLVSTTNQITTGKYSVEIPKLKLKEFDELRSRILIMTHSITERESLLKKGEEKLQNIIDSMPSCLITIDNETNILQWNNRAQKSFNIDPEIATSQKITDIFHSIIPEIRHIKECIKSRETKHFSNRARTVGDTVVYEDITLFPLLSMENCSVIRIDDVSSSYRIEEELNLSRKMEAIGQLAGGIAHDFNNMIAGISGAVQLLKSPKRDLDAKSLEYVDIIATASDSAAELTLKLLTFGRKGKSLIKPINIIEIIKDTKGLLERSIDKNILINFSDHSTESIIIADSYQVQNAFMNLCINSSQAMADGGHISFFTENRYLDDIYCQSSPFNITEGKYLEVEIRDTGEGIPLADLKRVFEPFYTTKDSENGGGLGLAAVYSIMLNLNGAIKVYSEVGVGTVFHLYFPCDHKIKKEAVEAKEMISGTGTILIIDDESVIRDTAEAILEDLGYTILLATNGEEAIEIYKEQHKDIDLVILDMIMPKISGRVTYKIMQEIDSNPRFIVSSGFSTNEDIEDMKENGLSAFIKKPFNYVDLSNTIYDLINE